MSNEEYHAAPGVNASKLKTMTKCPALIEWEQNCPVDNDKTGAIDLGTAFHVMVLEPEKFDGLYVVEPQLDRRTKEGKALAAEFELSSQAKTILTALEFKKLSLMRGSLMAHPIAKQLLLNQIGTEISIFAEDGDGELLKIRIDLESEINGVTFVVDLKSIDRIENISKAINERGYDISASHYRHVYRLHHGKYPDYFLLIFVAKTAEMGRYPVQVGEISGEDMAEGERKRAALLNQYKECKASGVWPGITTFSRYKWADK